MTRAKVTKTSFTAGELDPELLGRLDLRAYEDGAAKLRNVIVLPSGGVRRRPGTLHVASAPGAGRLIALPRGDATYLLVVTHNQIDIFADGQFEAAIAAPWTEDDIRDLSWTQDGKGLLACHRNVEPQRLVRGSGGSWSLQAWRFVTEEVEANPAASDAVRQPYVKFADDVLLQATSPSAAGDTVTLTASDPVFTAAHLGTLVRMRGSEIEITNVQSSTVAVGLVLQTLGDATTTANWDEQAFSAARGWPIAATFHQNRLVIGGSRDAPNRVWLSKTGNPFNFDLGTGLDDESIDFALTAERGHRVRGLFAGRHLEIYTDAGEWVAAGVPLTPANIRLQLQTRVGSRAEHYVPPRDVDGATLFIGRTGKDLREFIFADTQQAYQAGDLALLSRHLLFEPVDQDFDQLRRLFFVVMGDGTFASVALDRNRDVAAWSLHETDGQVHSLCVLEDKVFLLVERDSGFAVEKLDETAMVDAGVAASQANPATVWSGFDHLEGKTVKVVADGLALADVVVTGGDIELAVAAREIIAGLPYRHAVDCLPVASGARTGVGLDNLYRPVRITFRVLDTQALHVDTGRGVRALPFKSLDAGVLDSGPQVYSGDVAVRTLGWRRGQGLPPWRVDQDAPLPCTLLSVTTELKVNA